MKSTGKAENERLGGHSNSKRRGVPKSHQNFRLRLRLNISSTILCSCFFCLFIWFSSLIKPSHLNMADHHEEDELAPTQTAGYRVGEKKTLEEYETLDAHDESLKKWKQSLGLGQASGKLGSPFLHLHFSLLCDCSLSTRGFVCVKFFHCAILGY